MEKEWGKYIVIGLVVLGVLYYSVQQGWIKLPEKETEKEAVGQIVKEKEIVKEVVKQTVSGKVPIESLKVNVKDKFTMDNVQDVNVEFWTPGADVSDPNQEPLDEVTTGSNGIGTTTNMILQTDTDYDIWFNGSSTYYDEKIDNWEINYNPETGKGFLMVAGKSYYPAVKVGSFVDVDTLPESQSDVVVDTGTDTIKYNETVGTGSMWFKMDIGNADANSELWDVVMCFRDSDGDMEGDEVTSITASYVSGSSAISIPGSLTGYWIDGMGAGGKRCIPIATKLGSAEKARWQFDITVDESNFDTSEEFEITFDDGGDFSSRFYPSKDLKATAETLIIGDTS